MDPTLLFYSLKINTLTKNILICGYLSKDLVYVKILVNMGSIYDIVKRLGRSLWNHERLLWSEDSWALCCNLSWINDFSGRWEFIYIILTKETPSYELHVFSINISIH